MDVKDMLGLTMKSVINEDNEELIFTTIDDQVFKLYHMQDCCESVSIDDISGNLSDLVGCPLTQSEEVSNTPPERNINGYSQESETWTFYKFATQKGYVTVRWYGSSNGYYSESVDFCKVTK